MKSGLPPTKSRRLFIVHHLGLGDHIICNGLYRTKAESFAKILFIVKAHNYGSVRTMLADVPNLNVIPIPSILADRFQVWLGKGLEILGWTVLRLGFFGKDYFLPGNSKSFDEQFYDQANLAFEARWNKFSIPSTKRSSPPSNITSGLDLKGYIFVHDDEERGFNVDTSFIPDGTEIIRPIRRQGVEILAYRELIENATELHMIESSFLALAESLGSRGKRFVHEYARPETVGDHRHRQTLRQDWTRIERRSPQIEN